MSLYLDGQLIGTRTDVSSGQDYPGFWRVGGDTRWVGTSDWFNGRVDEVAIYDAPLNAATVQRHFSVGRTGVRPNLPPRASATASGNGLTASFDGTGSSDPDGSLTRYSWAFGDGTSGTGATVAHTYAAPGTYRAVLTVTDDRGATATVSRAVSVVTTGQAGSSYSRAVLADGAANYWRFDEPSGNGIDLAGSDDLVLGTGVRRGAAGAVAGDADTAATFDGTAAGIASTRRQAPAPNVFTVEAWFRTTSTVGGKLFGYGSAPTGDSPDFDRHVYMDPSGLLYFGVWPQQGRLLQSSRPYNDGRWHQVAAAMGPGGMTFYVDGQLIGARSDTTSGQVLSGYWRIGGDRTWAGAEYFPGDIDDVSIYPGVLSAAQVSQHYTLATAPRPNVAPTASFTSAPAYLTATFDGRASADTDGSVRSWAWSFGDGTTGTGATASHSYAAAGTYTVRLTVTDDAGATAFVDRTVTVTAPPPNQPPTAAFTATSTGLTVSLDGSTSGDADGTVSSFTWAFGDGSSGAGSTASHTFTAAGSYTVQLTVTDNAGATATASQQVTVSAPTGPPVLASDTFDRTVTGGLGTATAGGAWTVSAGATRQSVTPGVAELRLDTPNSNTGSYLGSVSQTGTDVLTAFSLTSAPTGSGTYVYVTGRRVAGAGEYRARVRVLADGRVGLALSRLVGTTEAFPGGETIVPGLTWTPGTVFNVRVQVTGTGTTTVRASVWAAGSAEPATPTITRSDTTAALQAAGGVGLTVHRPSDSTTATAVRFTGLTVTAAA
jgi:PKD repeat protein